MKASIEHWPGALVARTDERVTAAGRTGLPATIAQNFDSQFDFVWRNVRRLGVPESSADDVIAAPFGYDANTIHSRLRAARRAFEQAYARVQAGKEDLP